MDGFGIATTEKLLQSIFGYMEFGGQVKLLFWELATLAMTPFEEVDIFELTPYLADGFRLSQPINCPDEFFTVMSCCWLVDPKQRPSFPQLIAYLQDFYEDLSMYI
ncbi:Tyrosine-protein kinase RYK [Lucilia cuprina]|nr:Tyrosine-protein kinase RYK [Lucilia cuprina]